MKVLFQVHGLINDSYKSFFKSQVSEAIELIFPKDNRKETLLDLAPEVEFFVGYSVTSNFLEKASKLRHIQIPWTGFNSLDVSLLKNYKNFTISNSHSNSLSIAEHAIALMFSAAKLIVYRDSKMRKGDWTPRYQEENSFWITGKTLGIIGYGAIGKKVAKMMKYGFNMKIMAIKRNNSSGTDELCDYIGGQQDIDYVLKESDFVLVAVPLTEETRLLLNQDRLSKMKNSAVIVNIARGSVIDEKSLFEYLRDKKIGAAGIDVWYNYPENAKDAFETKVNQNYPFEELDNVTMSPHSAFKVRDREEVFSLDIIENIRLVYENKPPINQVNLELGY